MSTERVRLYLVVDVDRDDANVPEDATSAELEAHIAQEINTGLESVFDIVAIAVTVLSEPLQP